MPQMMGGFLFPGLAPGTEKFNATHVIHHLSFGPTFPGQLQPLDGHASAVTQGPAMFQYHVKIVPTLFEPLGGRLVDSNQFSATDFMQDLSVRLRRRGACVSRCPSRTGCACVPPPAEASRHPNPPPPPPPGRATPLCRATTW